MSVYLFHFAVLNASRHIILLIAMVMIITPPKGRYVIITMEDKASRCFGRTQVDIKELVNSA